MISRPLIGRLRLRRLRVWLPLVWLTLIRLTLIRLTLVLLTLVLLTLIRLALELLPLNKRCLAIELPAVRRVRIEARALVELGRRAGPLAVAFRAIALSGNRMGCRNERYRD